MEEKEQVSDERCVICGDVITVDRLSSMFEENGNRKRAHDCCLGQIEPSRARQIRRVE